MYSTGEMTITLGTIIYLAMVLVCLFYVTAWLERGIVERFLSTSAL